VITVDGYSWAIAGELSSNPQLGPARAAAVLRDLQESGWSLVYYLTPLGFIVGMLMLAVGASRQGAVPAAAGGVLALAVLLVGTETMIVSNAYFITGAVVFLVAGVAMAVPLLRMSDEDFAGAG
jgi:hypothetical protein